MGEIAGKKGRSSTRRERENNEVDGAFYNWHDAQKENATKREKKMFGRKSTRNAKLKTYQGAFIQVEPKERLELYDGMKPVTGSNGIEESWERTRREGK